MNMVRKYKLYNKIMHSTPVLVKKTSNTAKYLMDNKYDIECVRWVDGSSPLCAVYTTTAKNRMTQEMTVFQGRRAQKMYAHLNGRGAR